MEKDFDSWNRVKKQSNTQESYLPLYYEREIRWCRLGVNIGFEQDGTGRSFSRPVLILKGFSRRVCVILPLTTSRRRNRYHVSIGRVGDKEASVIISQIRLIDTRRLDKSIEVMGEELFKRIRNAVKGIL